jgi:GR25 family glycosyltransferase involved in LPS biosynthesis
VSRRILGHLPKAGPLKPPLPWDAAYCINLDRRTDCWKEFRVRSQAAGIDVIRFSAITPDQSPPPRWWRRCGPEQWACRESHMSVLADAIRHRCKRVLVFEDDALFQPQFIQQVESVINTLPAGWAGVLLFGNNVSLVDPKECGVARLKRATCTCAYLLSEQGMRALHSFWQTQLDYDVDQSWNLLFPSHPFFIVQPPIAGHAEGYSDTHKRWWCNGGYL